MMRKIIFTDVPLCKLPISEVAVYACRAERNPVCECSGSGGVGGVERETGRGEGRVD
jgi:hypothetical protein